MVVFHKKIHVCSRSSSEIRFQKDRKTIPADDWRLAAVHGVGSFPGLPGQVCGRSTLLSLGQLCKGGSSRGCWLGHLPGVLQADIFGVVLMSLSSCLTDRQT